MATRNRNRVERDREGNQIQEDTSQDSQDQEQAPATPDPATQVDTSQLLENMSADDLKALYNAKKKLEKAQDVEHGAEVLAETVSTNVGAFLADQQKIAVDSKRRLTAIRLSIDIDKYGNPTVNRCIVKSARGNFFQAPTTPTDPNAPDPEVPANTEQAEPVNVEQESQAEPVNTP